MMNLFVFVCLCNAISMDCLLLEDTFNVLMTDRADYKVDLVINADDLEMIDQNKSQDFLIDTKYTFIDLKEIAFADINSTLKYNIQSLYVTNVSLVPMVVVMGNQNNVITTYMASATEHAINKRDTREGNETEYDYDHFVDEYYEQANNESRSNNTYQVSKADISDYGAIKLLTRIFLQRNENDNCTQNVKGIGLQAIKCLVSDYNNGRQSTKDLVDRVWRIARIWLLVYLVVAVPLWCTRGWCCCCLCCKFFKPRQTIEEAKKYVVLYPPGVFKTKHGELRYEPSAREKECYEEFEHFIKTL